MLSNSPMNPETKYAILVIFPILPQKSKEKKMIIELDSTTCEWVKSDVLTDRLAVIPSHRHIFSVVINLPEKFTQQENWLQKLQQIEQQYHEDECCSTAQKAYDFYNKILNEIESGFWLDLF
jgi:hypothetical protein